MFTSGNQGPLPSTGDRDGFLLGRPGRKSNGASLSDLWIIRSASENWGYK